MSLRSGLAALSARATRAARRALVGRSNSDEENEGSSSSVDDVHVPNNPVVAADNGAVLGVGRDAADTDSGFGLGIGSNDDGSDDEAVVSRRGRGAHRSRSPSVS